MIYDSTKDTKKHIERIGILLDLIICDFNRRKADHDKSKLEDLEKSVFDEVAPALKTLTYGSTEYKKQLSLMGDALNHHYAHNRHHPEHFSNGINDMNLMDLLEMLADWKAATERHADGNLFNSLNINKERFNISSQLCDVLFNTARDMGWLKREKHEVK